MGRRARGRYRCRCGYCLGNYRERQTERFEAKLVDQALTPNEDVIYDSWYDWEKSTTSDKFAPVIPQSGL
jgi:hypothetical protein